MRRLFVLMLSTPWLLSASPAPTPQIIVVGCASQTVTVSPDGRASGRSTLPCAKLPSDARFTTVSPEGFLQLAQPIDGKRLWVFQDDLILPTCQRTRAVRQCFAFGFSGRGASDCTMRCK